MTGRRASLLDVVERVLGNIPNARVRVLPDGTGSGLDLAREALDQGGLARAVRPDARHTTGEGHLDGRLLDGHFIVSRIFKGDVHHFNEGLALGFDACDENTSC